MPTVTVTFDQTDYYEVINLLQLMTVFGVQLYAQGMQPDLDKLRNAFRAMSKAQIDAALASVAAP